MAMGQVNWFRRQWEKHKTDIKIHPVPHRIWCIFTSNFKNVEIPSNEILVKILFGCEKTKRTKKFCGYLIICLVCVHRLWCFFFISFFFFLVSIAFYLLACLLKHKGKYKYLISHLRFFANINLSQEPRANLVSKSGVSISYFLYSKFKSWIWI